MSRATLAALSLGLAVAGCASNPVLAPTAAPEVEAEVRTACATTPYRNCVRDALTVIQQVPHGTLIAICDLGSGNGDVVTVSKREDADATCSSGGTVVPSEVVAVIAVS